jgi:nucleotide-binding universal stress UspA family protein
MKIYPGKYVHASTASVSAQPFVGSSVASSLLTCSRVPIPVPRSGRPGGLIAVHCLGAQRPPVQSSLSVYSSGIEQSRSADSHTYVLAVDLFHNWRGSMDMATWALRNLCRSQDRVFLLHCVVLPPLAQVYALPDGRLVSSANILDALRLEDCLQEDMEENMEAFKAELQTFTDAHVESRVVKDPDVFTAMMGISEKKEVVEMLDHETKELNADALVIASNSRGGLAEWLMSSVAAGSVRHNASVDAVIVYRTGKTREEIEPKGAKRIIVVPVDESEASKHAVDWVAECIAREGDVVHLLHIVPSIPFMLPSTPTFGLSPVVAVLGAEMEEKHRQHSEEFVNEAFVPMLQSRGIEYRIDVLVELTDGSTGGLGKAIVDRSVDVGCSMICVGSGNHGGWSEFLMGSVANYIDHHSPMPVIVVH